MHRTRNNRFFVNRLFGNAFAEVDLLQNLTFRTSLGGEVTSRRSHEFTYPEYENAENNVISSFTTGTSYRQKDRKSTRLNSSHVKISYAVFCLKKKIKSTSNL